MSVLARDLLKTSRSEEYRFRLACVHPVGIDRNDP